MTEDDIDKEYSRVFNNFEFKVPKENMLRSWVNYTYPTLRDDLFSVFREVREGKTFKVNELHQQLAVPAFAINYMLLEMIPGTEFELKGENDKIVDHYIVLKTKQEE